MTCAIRWVGLLGFPENSKRSGAPARARPCPGPGPRMGPGKGTARIWARAQARAWPKPGWAGAEKAQNQSPQKNDKNMRKEIGHTRPFFAEWSD